MGIVKKITCLALVVMMLLSSFITPITILAEEIEKSVNESEKEIVEISNEKELAENYDKTVGLEKGSLEEEKNEELQSKEENQSSKENIAESNENREEVPYKPKMLKAPLGAAPTGGNELKDRVKQTTKENLTIKMKNDEYEINQFNTQFISGADLDENGNLVWTPNNAARGHEFIFRVNYAISGLKELPAGSIQITIPKSILRNRSGELDDYYEMSLPTSEEFDGSTEFAYIENEDYIVVYNPEEVEAGINGYFEIAYATNSETFEYKDYDAANTQLITEGGTASDPFYAIINVNTGNDALKGLSENKNVYINTTAKIESTYKRYPTIYRSWDSSWTETEPTDKDEYYYLVWEIRTYVDKDLTQKYNFSLEDVLTDLTQDSNGEDYQIVGYKFAGQKYYASKNTQQNQTLSGYRYDYVLTRHKISTYSWRNYKLKNTVTAVMNPIDQVDEDTKATSSNTFSWTIEFKAPAGHFNVDKWGNNNWHKRFYGYWDYANYDLDKMQKGELNELVGFRYYTETEGYAYPWTIKEGGSTQGPEDYGYNKVTYDTYDDTLYLEEDTKPMSYEDYYLEKLKYAIYDDDAEYDDFENKFGQVTATYENDETIIFYGKFKDSEEWVEIGKYNLGTKEITPNDTYVSQMTEDQIDFKEGVNCVGWRFTTTNKHYYTYIVVQPYYTITNSEYVKEKIANKDVIQVENYINTKVYDYKGKQIYEEETSAIDYARVTYYDSELTKQVASVSNNVLKKQYNITWRVNAWEKATAGSGEAEYIRQTTGKFYDLIPYGGEVNLDSIQVQTEKGVLQKNEYEYELIPNYNDSGRAMLVIYIKDQAQYYKVFYTTVHSWDNIKDFGRNVLNPVAYETGNEKIYNGYPDDGGNLEDKNKEIFVDLDKETDDNKFIYTEQTYDINAITAAVSGLSKKVKNGNEAVYSYFTEAESNGSYEYRLRYQNDYTSTAKDLILFDSIENFKMVNSEEGTTKTSGWKGILKSIDLNQLKLKGIDPVIYVSTIEDLDLEQNNDLNDESVWQKLSIFDDYSDVKAIAIDMTKDMFGNEYVLGTGESISVILHMQAPAEISEEAERNPYAYNNIYIKNTLVDEFSGSAEYFIHQDYTTVKYHVVADVPFVKVNEKDETEPIKGITFRLYGISDYDNRVDEYVTSDNKGQVIFKGIEAGEYILQEYETTTDWLEDHTEHSVKITINGKVYIDDELITDITSKKIANTPRAHTDVTITKRNLLTNGKICGAKFKLSGTSNYGTEVLKYEMSDEYGEVKFEDLEYGTYDLKEIETPEGYILNNQKYRVVVDEDSNYDVLIVSDNDGEEVVKSVCEGRYYNIYNEPLHSFRLVKKDKYDDNFIVGAKFRLVGMSDYGTQYDKEAQSEVAGITIFEGLEPGTYILQETFVPEVTDTEGNIISYKLDENKYIVNIDKLGNTTIEGLEKNENGNFVFYNQRNKGQITITKKWVDKSNNEERPEPVIHISTEKPIESRLVYFRGGFDEENGPLYYINSEYKDLIEGSFARKLDLTEEQVKEIDGVTRLDRDYDNPDAEYKIYAWIDEEGNCWWWTNAETAMMTDDSRNMFRGLENIISIDATYINTTNVTDMSSMFYECWYLEDLNISNWDTRNVTDMSYMFYDCESLIQLDISNFDTKNVTDMSHMFDWCVWVIELDLSNFDTSNVTSMSYMFNDCDCLERLDISSFNTSNVTDMSHMFDVCLNLLELDVSNFDTRKVTDMSYMFEHCQWLFELDVSNFDTSNVTNMSWMFQGCCELKELDLSNFDTSNVTDMSHMFYTCNRLQKLDVSSFDTSNVTNMDSMFAWCCYNLEELDISNFDTSNVINMREMFSGCSELQELDLSNFNTSKVLNMKWMFYECNKLQKLDVSSFDTSNVTDMNNMFYNCKSLEKLYVSNFNTASVTDMGGMFDKCSSLQELDVSKFDTSNVTNMGGMFNNCSSLQELVVSEFDTSNVTNMTSMFNNCSSLQELDLSNFDTSNVTDMSHMFDKCNNLITIYASDTFTTSNVTKNTYYPVFEDCDKLKGGNGTAYNSSNVKLDYARIDKPGQPGYFTYKELSTASIDNKNIILNTSLLNNNADVEITEIHLKEAPVLLAQNEENPTSEVLSYSTAETNYDDAGNEIHWVKNGDTWTYTIYVEDPNATWYAWEDEMEGYDTTCPAMFPEQIENQEITVYNYAKGQEVVVSNGNIKIKKSVYQISKSGDEDIYTQLTSTEDNTEFKVKVILTASENKQDLISGTKIFGDYIFKDGVTYIKLRAGETVIITGIPEGISYEVQEERMKDYEPTYSEQTGVVQADETIEVGISNYKDIRNKTDIPDVQSKTSFTVAKVVTGNYEIEEDYSLEIVLDNLKPNAIYSLSNGTTFESDSTGAADITITLRNGESVTVQDIPVGTKYKVYEYEGNYVSSYKITDSNNLGLINNSAARNTKENTAISTMTETADEGEAVTITFTNEKQVTQDLKIRKAVTDEEDTNSYIFNIELTGMKSGYAFNSTVGKIIADENGKAELTIYLAGGEEVELYGIPVGTKYKVTELASNSIASYTITDENGVDNIVKAGNANSVNRTQLSTEEETVNEGEKVTITFINDTVDQEPDKVTTSLGVKKSVLGIDGEQLEDCEEIFTFEIKAENENNPMPEHKTVTIEGNGEASFGELIFEKTGTYTYTIVEKVGDLEEYEYDNTVYTIVYEVTNPEGLLELTKTVKKNGFQGEAIEFTNRIYKVGVKILNVNENEDPLEGVTMQIVDEDGNVVKEWTTGDENSEGAAIDVKLETGIYKLKEIAVPDGYEITENIEFVVNEDGTVTVAEEIVDLIIVKNEKRKEADENKTEEENSEQESENTKEEKSIINVKTGDNIVIYEYILVISIIAIAIVIKKK